jgi:hypothetical protein
VGYLPNAESEKRVAQVREIMKGKGLDIVLVYYDEFNIGNGWYLTGWCPQFESGAVLVPRDGEPMILGGPESEPFAKLDSAITETRNFPVFMVPDEEYPNATIIDFPKLFAELNARLGSIRRVGLVGAGRMPVACHEQIVAGFRGVDLVDVRAGDDRARPKSERLRRRDRQCSSRLGSLHGQPEGMHGAPPRGLSPDEGPTRSRPDRTGYRRSGARLLP